MYQVVIDNIKTIKDQHNDAIEKDPKFDSSFNLSRVNKEPLPVVTVRLRGRKKHIAMTVYGLTYLWGSGAINSMVKRRHNKYYECNMWYNKL